MQKHPRKEDMAGRRGDCLKATGELARFLGADRLPVTASPEFREGLRLKLLRRLEEKP